MNTQFKKSDSENANVISESDYRTLMSQIESLMLKGSERLSKKELVELRNLSLHAQDYERIHYAIEPPTTFAGLLERKMYEMKLKQRDLAKKLQISPAKLSLVLNEKQRPDVALIKAAYRELQLDGNMLMRVL